MEVKTIVEDAVGAFLKKNGFQFWGDNIVFVQEFTRLISKRVWNNNADTFSVASKVLVDASSLVDSLDIVPDIIWKPVLEGVIDEQFAQLDADYDKVMGTIRESFKAPTSQVFVNANKNLAKLRQLNNITDVMKKSKEERKSGEDYIRSSALDYTENILRLFPTLDLGDTQYITAIEIFEGFKSVISESLKIVIDLSPNELTV